MIQGLRKVLNFLEGLYFVIKVINWYILWWILGVYNCVSLNYGLKFFSTRSRKVKKSLNSIFKRLSVKLSNLCWKNLLFGVIFFTLMSWERSVLILVLWCLFKDLLYSWFISSPDFYFMKRSVQNFSKNWEFTRIILEKIWKWYIFL